MPITTTGGGQASGGGIVSPPLPPFDPAALPGFLIALDVELEHRNSNLFKDGAKTQPAAEGDFVFAVFDSLSGFDWKSTAVQYCPVLRQWEGMHYLEFGGNGAHLQADARCTGPTLYAAGRFSLSVEGIDGLRYASMHQSTGSDDDNTQAFIPFQTGIGGIETVAFCNGAILAGRVGLPGELLTLESFVIGGAHIMSLDGSDSSAAATSMGLNSTRVTLGEGLKNDAPAGSVDMLLYRMIFCTAIPTDRGQVRQWLTT